ncbi:MAG TPA: hypothetical protein VGP07_06605 [Polyangia bacterium]|jgi:hypothetical protein
MKRLVKRYVWLLFAALVGMNACGDLDDVTTVKDLRVLAVMAEPAGFLVPLDAPGAGSPAALQATLTALVVDPKGAARPLTFSGEGCPDYLDTISAASGQGTRVCPDARVTGQFPAPVGPALATTTLFPPDAPGAASPAPPSTIEYHPRATFGLTPEQLGLFFSPAVTGDPTLDGVTAYNRDFGLDAIVDLTFRLGSEDATVIKRVVYWPLLPAAEVPASFTLPQLPNQNPRLVDIQLFRHRNTVTGDPEDPWPDSGATLSLAAKDKLYVLPVPAPDAAERYLLRARNSQTSAVETLDVARELLTYRFYATAGTFDPDTQQSELSSVLTSPDGRAHIDSQYNLPKLADLPPDGEVTVWIVVRDERAGTSWDSRTFTVTP